MARFKWKGPIAYPFVLSNGPTHTIIIPKSDGTKITINAADPSVGFVVDADLGIDVTDVRALRVMRVDPRFQEIV